MKVEKKEIAGKLKKLKGLLNSRLNVNEGVLVKGNTLFAGNREIGVRTTIDVPASDEEFVIPKSAIDFIDNLPNDTVEITGDDKSILIKCGKVKNKVQTFGAEKIPEPNEITAESNTTFNGEDLLNIFKSVLYAAADNSAREMLNGILLEAHGGKLNIVGCDGFRIAWNKIDYDGDFKVIIPKDAARQIISLGLSGDVSIAWDKNGVCFKNAEYEVYSRIFAGEYVKYESMFMNHKNETIIDRKALLDCLNRALLCSADATNHTLKFDFCGDNLSVSLHKGKSEYEEMVALEENVTVPLEIGFNGKYLVDAIKDIDDDKITVKIGTNRQPFVIVGGELRALVFPMTLPA